MEVIDDGLIVVKNFNTSEIKQDCIRARIYISGNSVVGFRNCRIEIGNFEATDRETDFMIGLI